MQSELKTVGLVAGRGRYPLLFCEEARRHGVEKLIVVAMHDETEAAVADLATQVTWVYVGQIGRTIAALSEAGVRDVVFAGQITPGRLFSHTRPDWRGVKLLARLKLRNAESIFSAVAEEFTAEGLTVRPATLFLEDHLATPGVMGRVRPKAQQTADIAYGQTVAREVSRLNIGQTVVVRHGTVLAVEAFEGTDAAIRRGGELGKREDVTVVKVAKPRQDLRFDVPCIGAQTVASLTEAGVKALGVQAGATLLLDKPAVISALDQAKISVVGFTVEERDPETAGCAAASKD